MWWFGVGVSVCARACSSIASQHSNAMLLPLVTEFSLSSCVDRYADCARCMGVASSNDSHEEAAHKLLDSLKCLNADLQVPTPADFGIDPARFQEVLGTMADQVS